MRNLSIIFALVLLFTSCKIFSFDNPEMRGNEEFKISKINGRTIEFTAAATVYNPNWYRIKVKPSELELYVEGAYMGTIQLDQKVKLKRKKENYLQAAFTATLEDGVLIKAMKFATMKEIEVRLKGKIKGGVFIFSKKFDFDETKTIPGASFKI
ncbi:MAG: LEA type 2 family protein [Crocinitomicaceae bacterium]